MQPALLILLIIIGNLCLYWVLVGQHKWQDKLAQEEEHARENSRH